jgi:ribulose kinase
MMHGQDSGLNDLARKFNVTMEAIALQTRHIIDEMNSKGHEINTIYMSGGQASNIPLMQLFADICQISVVLPFSHSNAVVLGAAMLGRFAAEASAANLTSEMEGKALWDIMVCSPASAPQPMN